MEAQQKQDRIEYINYLKALQKQMKEAGNDAEVTRLQGRIEVLSVIVGEMEATPEMIQEGEWFIKEATNEKTEENDTAAVRKQIPGRVES